MILICEFIPVASGPVAAGGWCLCFQSSYHRRQRIGSCIECSKISPAIFYRKKQIGMIGMLGMLGMIGMIGMDIQV